MEEHASKEAGLPGSGIWAGVIRPGVSLFGVFSLLLFSLASGDATLAISIVIGALVFSLIGYLYRLQQADREDREMALTTPPVGQLMEENPFKKPDYQTGSGIWAGTVRPGLFRLIVYSLLAFSLVLQVAGIGKSDRELAVICLAGAAAFALIGYLSHHLQKQAVGIIPEVPLASRCYPPGSAGQSSCDPASITTGC